jgi:predicted peptidase
MKNPYRMRTNSFRLLTLFALSLVFIRCKKDGIADKSAANNNIPETLPASQVAVSADVTPNLGGFYKSLPARYDSTTKKYPLMVFIHGVGELGNGTTELSKVLNNGVPRLLADKKFPPQFTVNNEAFSFVVLTPQFKQWPKSADVNELINYAIKNYRIDESRIYVAGLSMGGGTTWDYAIAYPNRVAAIVPICGASWPTQQQCGNIASANLPVWAFHNADDGTVGAGTTTMIVDFINSFKPSIAAKKTIWPTGGHNSWTKATNPATKECEGKNMYEWMLQYKRSSN